MPTFANLNAEVLIDGILQYCDGKDVLSLREVLHPRSQHGDRLENRIASYKPKEFVNIFLDMIRASRMSTSRTHHNASFMIEYYGRRATHDRDGHPINQYNHSLAQCFQFFFGQSPDDLYILCHRLTVRHPDIKAKHLLWACWELKRHSYSGPNCDYAMFLNFEPAELSDGNHATAVMDNALKVIKKIAGLFDATPRGTEPLDPSMPFLAPTFDSFHEVRRNVEVYCRMMEYQSHEERSQLTGLCHFFMRFRAMTCYRREEDDRIDYVKAVVYFANNPMASQHGLVLDESI